jgi:hypothetical protein
MNKNQKQEDPYIKACHALGIAPRPALEDRSDKRAVSEDGYHRLIICIEAKNMIDGQPWKRVYDGSQLGYYPWWKPDPSGLGFTYSYYDDWPPVTPVGPRLEYRTRELLLEGMKEFKPYYDDYFNN